MSIGDKEISKKPRLRFKGFTEDWEQRKLGECVLIQRGGSPRPIENYLTKKENGVRHRVQPHIIFF